MKKTVTGVVALLAGAFAVYSQGTISFANYAGAVQAQYTYVSLTVRLSPPYTGASGDFVLGGPSTVTTGYPLRDTANGDDWTVALYGNAGWNDPASTLVPLMTANGSSVTATLADDNADSILGTWYSPDVALIPGTTGAGQPATVQIYAWYNDGGRINNFAAAYAAALAYGFPIGWSATANIVTGGPQVGGPDLPPANLPSFQYDVESFVFSSNFTSSIAEPNTIALAFMGASGFMAYYRRARNPL
jgi:hypothetical protein